MQNNFNGKSNGNDFNSVLHAIYGFTCYDTVSAFVRRGKVGPAKLLEKQSDLMRTFAKLGEG
ncbi:hypothetical protein DPMN_175856 [Dreissena polymorpha]|uniref:Uncharacterized protein n=1 Tax=Dreissena polymorpha TaxID=45954 RepID=A0A9D4E5X0_DREPO|nr:hypothetical protein DPMN_175856 [Dreissena polymorpha]